MYSSTLNGTLDGSVKTLGRTLFLFVSEWGRTNLTGYQEFLDAKPNSSMNHPMYQCIVGFKKPGQDWVLVKNESGSQAVGRTLNGIDSDKKKRLTFEDFEVPCDTAYCEALREELATFDKEL